MGLPPCLLLSFSHGNNNKNNPKKNTLPNKKVRKEKKAEIPEKTKKEQPRKEKQTVKIKSQDYETFFCLSKTFCFTLLHKKSMRHVKKEKSKTQKNRQISILSKKYYEGQGTVEPSRMETRIRPRMCNANLKMSSRACHKGIVQPCPQMSAHLHGLASPRMRSSPRYRGRP